MGAPINTLSDLPGAIRERRQNVAKRCLEPVAVAWEGNPSPLTFRLPAPGGFQETGPTPSGNRVTSGSRHRGADQGTSEELGGCPGQAFPHLEGSDLPTIPTASISEGEPHSTGSHREREETRLRLRAAKGKRLGRGSGSADDREAFGWKSSHRQEGVEHERAPAAAWRSQTLAERSDGRNSEVHPGKQKQSASPLRGIPSFSGCTSDLRPLTDAAIGIKIQTLLCRRIPKLNQN